MAGPDPSSRPGGRSGGAVRPDGGPPPGDPGSPDPDGAVIGDRLDALILAADRWRDRPWPARVAGAVVLVVALVAWWLATPPPPTPVEARVPLASTADGSGTSGGTAVGGGAGSGSSGSASGAAAGVTAAGEAGPVVVHVAGAVTEPGIVELDPGARVVDAVAAAGGPSDDADLHQLNLAAPAVDGSRIRVPAVGEEVVEPVTPPLGTTDGPDGGAVDINRAGPAELEELPGIGPALAAAIVDWRDEHGPFTSVDELLDVPGIGPAKLATLAERATV